MSHGAVRLTYLDHAAADTTLESTPQIAFALSRKFGPATERNRARRRLRDAFAVAWDRHLQTTPPALRLDGAFLLSGHRRLLTAPFDSLVDDVGSCLTRLMAEARKRETLT